MKLNNTTIREAVALWCEDQIACIKSFGHISNWDTSEVTDMSLLFLDKNSFNEDISSWNVSNVTDMTFMFYEEKSFNQSIGNWDMSRVSNKKGIFFLANYEMINKYGDDGEKIDLIDSGENNRFLSSWSTQELRGMHNLFKTIIFEASPMTDEKHKDRLRAMIGFFQMAYCSNQNTYSFLDNKDYQNFVKEIQLDKILPSKEGIDSLRGLNKRKKNELLFIATILITQSDVGWDEVFETKEFNLIRKLLAIYQWDENSYNKIYEIYCEEDDKRLNSL